MIEATPTAATAAAKLRDVPEPELSYVANATRFPTFRCQKLGPGREYFDTLVLKASYPLRPGLLGEPVNQPIVVADRWWNESEPLGSSLKAAGEVVMEKPGGDLFLTGHARIGAPMTRWTTGVVVRRGPRTLASLTLEATGPRSWVHRALRGWSLSDPAPTTEVPIRYELAYGGRYVRAGQVSSFRANPSGSGFFDTAAVSHDLELPGPQWEHEGEPVTTVNGSYKLAGFGPVSRSWSTRLAYAGTRDEAFVSRLRREVAEGLPSDYPADFNRRFFQVANPSLQLGERFEPGDVIALRGLTGTLDWQVLELPSEPVLAELHSSGGPRIVPMAMDTVHIDLDAGLVNVLHRLTLDVRLGVSAVALFREGD
jgi:hypothetical protein